MNQRRGMSLTVVALATVLLAGAVPARIGGYTPLHLASQGAHGSVVSALLEAGANAGAGYRYGGLRAGRRTGIFHRFSATQVVGLNTISFPWIRP